jgi:hypothetical protein
MTQYLADTVIPRFRGEKITGYYRVLAKFSSFETNNSKLAAQFWQGILSNTNLKNFWLIIFKCNLKKTLLVWKTRLALSMGFRKALLCLKCSWLLSRSTSQLPNSKEVSETDPELPIDKSKILGAVVNKQSGGVMSSLFNQDPRKKKGAN